jgi:hypothetical protein
LVTHYQALIAGLDLPDANDRHVLAAAVHGGASVIVTANGKDFPKHILNTYEVEAIHPDDFLVDLWDLDRAALIEAAAQQRRCFKRPAMIADDYLDMLRRQGLVQIAALLGGFKMVI